MTRLVPVLLLVGCPWIGPETHDGNFPEGTNVSEITLSSIEPAFGPTGLLTDVVLTGEGFEPDEADSYAVSVRGLDITDLQVTETTISFTMPALATAGAVDVVFVEFDDDSDDVLETALVEGFEYFPNRAQFTGLFGIATYVRYISGIGTWPGMGTDGGFIALGFLTPTSTISPVEQYTQSPGTCRNQYIGAGLTLLDMSDDSITLQNSRGVDVPMHRQSANESIYLTDDTQLISGTDMLGAFELLPIAGDPDLPSFGLKDIFEMPPDVQLDGQSVDIAGGDAREGSFRFSWTSESSSTDFIVITVDVYNSTGDQYFESVYCVANDSAGQFGIPNNTITNWVDGNLMNVQVGRMRTVHNTLPHDDSGVVFPATNWRAGYITQRQ